MKFIPKMITLACSLLLISSFSGLAADKKEASLPAKKATELNSLEASFQKTMTKVRFIGRWCLVKEGKLTPEKEDQYTIIGVKKVKGDTWQIDARIQYGKNDVTVPLLVKVKWAGDTPVITVDNLWIPGIGTYSARVVVYDNTYAGTWSGPNYGGLLNGLLKKDPSIGKK